MGYLIVIDGLDGSGKKTQSTLLYKRLKNTGKNVRMVSFPDYDSDSSALVKMYLGGKFGKDPNAVNCYAASSFFAVDRYASFNLDWKKDYDNGAIIIANRYTTANAIHQLTKLEGEEKDKFLDWIWTYEFELLGLPKPDITFLLEVPVEKSLELIKKRGEACDIHENSQHLLKAYEAAMHVCARWGWEKINCTEGNELLSVEKIGDLIWKRLIEKSKGRI